MLLLLVALALVVAACSEGDSADPEQVFADSITAMKALESFHFTYAVTKPAGGPPVQGLDIVGLEGDVTNQGSMQADIDVQNNGVPLRLGFVAIGDTYYIQDPVSKRWQAVPASLSPVGELNLSAGTIAILEKVQEPSSAGREKVGDVECYHLTGKVSSADVADIVKAVAADKTFDAEVWIGVDDHWVRRVHLLGAGTAGEDPKTKREIELSRFNEDVSIQPPTT